MSGAIKGITIEFRGNTTSLDQALNKVKKEAKNTSDELKYINKALKFNPTSVEAWRQKQIVLNKAIKETEQKLELMKNGLKEMEAQGLNSENSEEFRRMQREIDQTERQLKSLKTELKGIGNVNLRAASEQFKQWGTSLEKAGQSMREVSMAAAALTASIGALAVKSGKWADDLNTMSKRYSVGTQELQKYSLAADLVDVSTEDIVKSQTKLKKSMLSSTQGSKNITAAFEKLGVSVTDSNGNMRDGEEVWNEVIAALGSMENETERDALAMQLLGKSAANLNPLIEDSGETYKRLSETMQKYGLDFIDQETLDKANEFNDELDTIKAIGLVTLQSLGTELAGYLAPALEKVVDWVGKFAQWLSNLSPTVLTVVAGVAAFVAVLAPVLIGLGKVSFAISAILGLMANLAGAFGGLVAPVVAIVAVIGILVAAFRHLWTTNEEFRTKMTEIWETVKTAFLTFVEDFSKKFSELVAIFTGGTGSIKELWTAFCNFIGPYFELAFSTLATVLEAVFNTIIGLLDIFIGLFNGNWSQAWDGVKTVFEGLWTGIVAIVQTAWTLIVTAVSVGISAVQTAITTIFTIIATFIKTVWERIKTSISTAIENARIKVVGVVNGIRTFVTTTFNNLKATVQNAWNAIKTAITSPIEKAKDKVKQIIDKIKGFFPIKLGNIINFKTPTISLKTSSKKVLGKTITYPSGFDVSWHKQGGIFDEPTLLQSANGALHGVGEAGAEAIIPLDKFWRTLEATNEKTDALLVMQNRILLAMYEELQKDKDFRIDGRVAGRIINDLVRV